MLISTMLLPANVMVALAVLAACRAALAPRPGLNITAVLASSGS